VRQVCRAAAADVMQSTPGADARGAARS